MRRREFLRRTGGTGAGLLALGRASWPGVGAGAGRPPFDLRFRQVHLDFHSSAEVPDLAAEFDPDAFADTLARAHVDSVTCFARCHHGFVYYDTKRNPERKHPTLRRPRLLEEQVEACHRRGIRVPIYTTIRWDAFSDDAHPEWRQVTEAGDLQGTPPFEPGFYRFLCLNPASPYLELLRSHLDDLFAAVPVDGLFLDIVHARECACHLCRRDMRAKGLDPTKAADRQTFAGEVRRGFVADTTAFVRARAWGRPGYPGVVRRGRAIDFAHPPFAQYHQNAPRWCRRLVPNAISLLLPDRLVRTSLPSAGLVAVTAR